MNIIFKLKSIFKKELAKEPIQDYQFIIHHQRATDRVFFGPFKNYEELNKFFQNSKNSGVQHCVEILISPTCPKEQYWYNPPKYLEENHSYLFQNSD